MLSRMTDVANRVWRVLRRRRRPLLVALLAVAFAGCGVTAGSALWVSALASGHLFDPEDVPERPVAIVFGSQVNPDGAPSAVLADRLDAARNLYQAGKVRAILVTGDNGQVEYDEVDPMRAWLVERGVPANRVVGDYAGFDTYSSCVRAVKIFGVREAVLVTQAYHLTRAVAVCRRIGMNAVGARAGTAGVSPGTLRQLAIRDKIACVKAVGELVVRPDPKYLGRHETGIEDALAE